MNSTTSRRELIVCCRCRATEVPQHSQSDDSRPKQLSLSHFNPVCNVKFGKVDHPERVDFTLPPDHLDTREVLRTTKGTVDRPTIYIGYAKWNRQDVKGFYPRGTKDELTYYATQLNAIELNTTFYRIPPEGQLRKWCEKTAANFRFFPKVYREISHTRQLQGVGELVNHYAEAMQQLGERLGTVFLQMHESFSPRSFPALSQFVAQWPKTLPIALEVRHPHWHSATKTAEQLWQLLRAHGVTHILVDTAGRRDMMHMRLTTSSPFIRYVSADCATDYRRLEDWVDRIGEWIEQGATAVSFFIHQSPEREASLLSTHFIQRLDERLGDRLVIPRAQLRETARQGNLFE